MCNYIRYKLRALILIHHIVVTGVALSPWISIVLGHYALGVLCLIIGHKILTRRTPCPLTSKENELRAVLGLPTIKTFIKHYYINPYRRFRNSIINGGG